MKNFDNQNWREPTEERCYYLDLEHQGRVWVTKEVFLEYMKIEWTEWKRNERLKRCKISNGKGSLKRCENDCSKCNHYKNNSLLSLDELYEKYKIDVSNSEESIKQKVIKDEIIDKLHNIISSFELMDQRIMNMLLDGYSEYEISKIINVPRTTISYRKKICFNYIKNQLKDYI